MQLRWPFEKTDSGKATLADLRTGESRAEVSAQPCCLGPGGELWTTCPSQDGLRGLIVWAVGNRPLVTLAKEEDLITQFAKFDRGGNLLACGKHDGTVLVFDMREIHYQLSQVGLEWKRKGYLCQHRNPWYAQEDRPPPPFLCTYIGRNNTKRGRPFRFIFNHSRATAGNVYLLLYPKEPLTSVVTKRPELKRDIFEFLNAISIETLLSEGRVYGGGLYKLEPKELMNVPADSLGDLICLSARAEGQMVLELHEAPAVAPARLSRGRRVRGAV